MAFDKSKFLTRFVEEAAEHVNKINDGLLKLEKDPDNSELINSIFRSAHTIKGSSKMMKFPVISEVAHKLEDALDTIRSRKTQISSELSDILFKGVDAISDMLDRVKDGEEIQDDQAALCEELENVAQGKIEPPSSPQPVKKKRAPSAKAKFLARFVEEATENISRINEGLLKLEKNPDDSELINAIFRSAHTIKGSAKMMKLSVISEVAHKLEDALDMLRNGKIDYSDEFSQVLFKGIDIISDLVDKAAAGEDLSDDKSAVSQERENVLGAAAGDQKLLKKAVSTPEKTAVPAAVVSAPRVVDKDPLEEKEAKLQETIRISEEKLDGLIKLMGEIVSSHSRMKRRVYDISRIERISRNNLKHWANLENKIQLDTEKKRDLTEGINTLYQNLQTFVSSIKEDASILDLLTNELQDRALKMRMRPLSTIFDTFHRTVRDMSRSFGKKINFEVLGGETELDKKIIEKISDPLLHMIRNSIDHGVETPKERKQAGKAEKGTMTLAAGYEGGNVLIAIKDDGAGISAEKIKEKAIKKKMFEEGEIVNIPDTEIINLIFYPGFSTSEMITDISGRGVGMDVVKKNICEDLKGSIQVKTEVSHGTTFYIRLPLTIAVMHVMVVTVSDMFFAIPSNFIDEVVSVATSEIIDVVDRKAIRLREQIIPVAKLSDVLGIPTEITEIEDNHLVLIVTSGDENLGLIVNEVIKEEDRTIKPLPSHMKNLKWISGVTISGKNEIDNVLHIPNIIESAKEVKVEEHIVDRPDVDKKKINILVVDDSISTREIEKNILESYGYNVTVAGDGIDALENAKKFKYDVIITDIEMPRMDGFSLTENLRRNEKYRETPVILVSSRDTEKDKKRGMQAGADAYIIKGTFDQTNLLEAIQSLVG